MLRRKPGATASLDDVDQQLLHAVEAGLRWKVLLQSAPCAPEEAQLRILRLIQQGHLEGTPGDADGNAPPTAQRPAPRGPVATARFPAPPTSRVSRAGATGTPSIPAPSADAQARPSAPNGAANAPRASMPSAAGDPRASMPSAAGAPRASMPSAAGAPRASMPSAAGAPRASAPTPGSSAAGDASRASTPNSASKTLPPGALAAREALLRELATRRSGANFAPVTPPLRPSDPNQSPGGAAQPGFYSFRGSQSTASSAPPPASERTQGARSPATSAPPGRYSVTHADRPGATSSAPPGANPDAPSPLTTLIQELAGGADLQRWCAARLREAHEQDLSGEVQQALAIVQSVMAQLNDPRLRVERDRLHAKSLRAASGVYRARALRAEHAARHEEAAESWRKVLEACPDDAEAALHAAMCSMESGDIKQAGVHARRAVELAPNSVIAHKLLLRFFRKTGMELNANREREILRKLSSKG